jgi:hypothetical protein
MYALAQVVGFRLPQIRVRILNERGGGYDVVTADLVDAGTPLWLSKEKVTPVEETEVVEVSYHKDGLVCFQ